MANNLLNQLLQGAGNVANTAIKGIPIIGPQVNLQKAKDSVVNMSKDKMAATKAQLKKDQGGKLTTDEQAAISRDQANNMMVVMGALAPEASLESDATQLVRRGGVAPGEVGPPGYLAPKKSVSAGAEPNYAFDNQATSPMQDVPAPQQPSSPQGKSGNFVTNNLPFLNKPPKSPVRIVLNASIGGPAREKAVQQTVDTLVPGATATEKYTNLQPTMDNLGQQIQTVMKNSPKNADISEIMGNYDKNLQTEGVYRNSDITGNTSQKRDAIQKQAQGYITDLYNSARGETSDVVPTNISDQALYELKQQINNDASSIFKKINNGTTLTDKDRVVLAARQTIDDTLTQLHPEVKQLTTTQSHLYDAKDSLFNGREAEIKAAADQPQGWGKLGAVLKQPGIQTALGIAGLGQVGSVAGLAGGAATAGGAYLMNVLDNFRNSSNNQPNTQGSPSNSDQGSDQRVKTINQDNGVLIHEGSVSQGTTGVNRYQFDNDPYQSGQLMNQKDYVSQANALDTQIANAQATGNPVAMAQLQGQKKVLDNTFSGQEGLRNAWVGSTDSPGIGSTLKVAGQAYDAVQKASPDFYNALNGGYDKLRTASNGKYAQMAKYLEYLQQSTGTDFTRAGSKEALTSMIDTAVNATKSNWDNLQQGYNGAPQPVQTNPLNQILKPTAAPQRQQMPEGGFGGTGGLTGHAGLDQILNSAVAQ